jgi:hypothetical protein
MQNLKLLTTTLAIAICMTICLSSTAIAQIPQPVKWSFTSKKINTTTWEIHLTATIDKGWRLYAQEAGEGPVPTSFKFMKNPLAATTGQVKEIGVLIKKLDDQFDAVLKYYENKVVFVQRVIIKGKTKLKGSVEFMTAKGSDVLPPKEAEFSIPLG